MLFTGTFKLESVDKNVSVSVIRLNKVKGILIFHDLKQLPHIPLEITEIIYFTYQGNKSRRRKRRSGKHAQPRQASENSGGRPRDIPGKVSDI